jgi:hypothetical protein
VDGDPAFEEEELEEAFSAFSGPFYTSDDIGVELKGVRSGVERRRGRVL